MGQKAASYQLLAVSLNSVRASRDGLMPSLTVGVLFQCPIFTIKSPIFASDFSF